MNEAVEVMVIGSGGREHAFAWKLAQSPAVKHVYVLPGNGGTALEDKVSNIEIELEDFDAIANFAQQKKLALTLVGPEVPLVNGIVDVFERRGLPCFGPKAEAAKIEGSKAFCKSFLSRHDIPTAAYGVFTDFEPARTFVAEIGAPVAIKADGLAAGKGVLIAETFESAEAILRSMLIDAKFGDAGKTVVIEEFLEGEELSFIVITDGKTIVPMATSQDHKQILVGDRGLNTGGMGAYSPSDLVDQAMYQQIMTKIIEPTISGFQQDGIEYRGFLYAGLMLCAEGPKVIEYNCRFGDPETQPILMRLQSDFYQLCLQVLNRNLQATPLSWDSRTAIGVVLAAGGYPETYRKGDVINGLDTIATSPDYKIFHAGTKLDSGQIVTCGGRVLCATVLADHIELAQTQAHQLLAKIEFADQYYRSDIGFKAIARLKS